MGLWHTHGLPNLGQKTRPNNNQQKKENLQNCRLCCLSWSQNKMKECEKKDKYLNLARELKKLWNMQVTIIPIVIGAFGTVTNGLLKGLEDLEVGDHPNYYIIENDKNTEKSPGDLRRLAVTQTPVKDHQLTLMWKILMSEYNNNNNSLGFWGTNGSPNTGQKTKPSSK